MSHLRSERYAPFLIEPSRVRATGAPPAFAQAIRGSKAIRDGLKYQQKVTAFFEKLFGNEYVSDVWIEYYLGNDYHICSPDGIRFNLAKGEITIVEVKRTHTSSAFRQLRNRYLPILRQAMSFGRPPDHSRVFPLSKSQGEGLFCGGPSPWVFYLLEVAPAYDPLDSGGEKVNIVREPKGLIPSESGVNFLPFKRIKRWA